MAAYKYGQLLKARTFFSVWGILYVFPKLTVEVAYPVKIYKNLNDKGGVKCLNQIFFFIIRMFGAIIFTLYDTQWWVLFTAIQYGCMLSQVSLWFSSLMYRHTNDFFWQHCWLQEGAVSILQTYKFSKCNCLKKRLRLELTREFVTSIEC